MKEQKRCQFTPEGIKTFGKQRLGYAVEVKRDNPDQLAYRVRWDNLKGWQTYNHIFIDVSPLLALYSDDEIEKIAKEKEPQITPQNIDSIENNLKYIKETGLSERAIVILLHNYIGGNNIKKAQIEYVLKGLNELRNTYLIN